MEDDARAKAYLPDAADAVNVESKGKTDGKPIRNAIFVFLRGTGIS